MDVLAIIALMISVGLAVFVVMSKDRFLSSLGSLTQVVLEQNKQLEYLLMRDTEMQKHTESVGSALKALSSRTEKLEAKDNNPSQGLPIDEILKNLTAGAVSDQDFGDRE